MTENLSDLVEFFILGGEPCIGFHENKIEKTGITIYEFQEKLTLALRLQEKINWTDKSVYKECLETIEKIQFGKELDKWDSANLDVIERLLNKILGEKPDD